MYFFATLGMEWYGGDTLTDSLTADNPLLVGTKWHNYADVLGFRNIFDALLTIYQVANVVRSSCAPRLL